MSSTYNNRGSTLSRNMRCLEVENSKTMKSLDRELSRLETEKRNRMRELDQASRHFLDLQRRTSSARSREASPDRQSTGSSPRYNRISSFPRSPSPNPRSPLDDLTAMSECLSPRTHKIVYRKSLSTDDGGSPKQLSPTSSPESSPRRLLPRRSEDENSTYLKSSGHNFAETSITNFAYLSTSGACKQTLTNSTKVCDKLVVARTASSHKANQAGIPQIIVSDTTPQLADIKSVAGVNVTKQVSFKNSLKDKHIKNQVEENNDDSSLNVPIRRCRSNSVPAFGVKTDHIVAFARKKSKQVANDDSQAITQDPVSLRPRSNSVCVPYYEHLKNAPKRDSLLRPKMYHRTARTIDELISDIAKGISSEDLDMMNARYKPIPPEEWERLKQCRYLRMPSKNEDVRGNTLDIEEIFSHPSSNVD